MVTDDPLERHVSTPLLSALHQRYRKAPLTVNFEDFLAMETANEHLEALTFLDQEDPAWTAATRGSITASNADAIRADKDPINPPKSLFDRIMGTTNFVGSQYTQYGKEYEPIARQLYVIKEQEKQGI